MEEVQETQESVVETPQNPAPRMDFSVPQPKKQKSSKWIFIILGLLIVFGGALFLISRLNKGAVNDELLTPTPLVEGETAPTPEPTVTPAPVDRSKITIQIQNGTGITGEAAYLQNILKSLGYTDLKAGNANTQDHEVAEVTFAKSLSSQVSSEITKKLEGIYTDVNIKTSDAIQFDVVIITGLRKGATAKPVATAAATATPKPPVSPSPTPTATPTPTPTP